MSNQPKPAKPDAASRQVTTKRLLQMKQKGQPIACLTAYDFLMAQLLDQAGIDVILVGDSAGMVIQGADTTVSVTLDQMLYHSAVVARGVQRAIVVADQPFISYQVNSDEALRNAGRMIQEARVEAVKVEGGQKLCRTIEHIVDVGIPVMGHLGLTPQSIHKFGTYQVRATTDEEAEELRRDALAIADAGVFAIVLEKIPAHLATEVARCVDIPVIGIGAGGGCDGQILVTHDMLGIYTKFKPRFVRRYAELAGSMRQAFEGYGRDVRAGEFPTEDESY
jgi:3-methyl-2-oxobutanoate hydroxymethyltransferase